MVARLVIQKQRAVVLATPSRVGTVCSESPAHVLQIHFSVDHDADGPAVPGVRALLDSKQHRALPEMPAELQQLVGSIGLEAQKLWVTRAINIADIVVVIVGRGTYARPLIRHEIAIADAMAKPMFGIDVTTEAPSPPNPFAYVVSTQGRKIKPYPVHKLAKEKPDVSLSDFLHMAARHLRTGKPPRSHDA